MTVRTRRLSVDTNARSLCRALAQNPAVLVLDLPMLDIAEAWAHAIDQGWITQRDITLTDKGREIASKSRAGPRRQRRGVLDG